MAASNLNTSAEGLKTTDNSGYYSVTLSGTIFNGSITAVVDYNDAFSLGENETDGLANTKELFNSGTTGFNDASTLETAIGEIEYKVLFVTFNYTLSATGNSTIDTPDNYAVKMAVMKNRCHSTDGTTVTINDEDFNWYLPAINELKGVTGLTESYWSSTTTTGNSAYSYNGTDATATARTNTCKIRAARKR